jgi:hypothetical protein
MGTVLLLHFEAEEPSLCFWNMLGMKKIVVFAMNGGIK